MVFFFKNFVTFSEKIKKPIYKELQDKFWELNNLCNNYEDFGIKSQITNKDIDIDDLIIDRKNQNVCCEVGNSIVCILF